MVHVEIYCSQYWQYVAVWPKIKKNCWFKLKETNFQFDPWSLPSKQSMLWKFWMPLSLDRKVSILFKKLFWPTVRKVITKNFWKLEAESWEVAKYFRSICSNCKRSEQSLKQNPLFYIVDGGFYRCNTLEKLKYQFEKTIGM